MTAELALMRILKLMWVWETCQLLQVVTVCGVESMSCHTMNKVTSLDVDWEVMKEKAMNCLISMGVTYENISLNFGLRGTKMILPGQWCHGGRWDLSTNHTRDHFQTQTRV